MRVALFQDFLVRMGGAESTLAAFHEIFPNAPIYTTFYDKEAVAKKHPDFLPLIVPLKNAQTKYNFLKKIPFIDSIRTKFFINDMKYYVEQVDLSGFDLVIASSTASGHGLITNTDTKFVCYMHSPKRYVWDWYNEYKASLKSKDSNFIMRIFMFFVRVYLSIFNNISTERLWDQIAIKKEMLLLTNAQNVQKRIEKYYRRYDSIVLNPPIDIDQAPRPNNSTTENKDYFLIISTLAKYKSIDIVIDLFNRLGRTLIIIGDGPDKKRLQDRAERNIIFLGYQNEDSKWQYLKDSRALIYPSEEDFGMVPLEAMACGKPVLAYKKGGSQETIIPGFNGEFFTKPTADSLEKGLAKLLDNEENYDAIKIREFSEQFSKTNFIRKFKTILRKELGIGIN